jgi:hypothetical protein
VVWTDGAASVVGRQPSAVSLAHIEAAPLPRRDRFIVLPIG